MIGEGARFSFVYHLLDRWGLWLLRFLSDVSSRVFLSAFPFPCTHLKAFFGV